MDELMMILNELDSAILDAMQGELAQLTKEVTSESVHSNVYAAYASTSPRRMDGGGLSSTENLNESVSGGGGHFELTVRNTTPYQGSPARSTLSDVVQDGDTGFRMPFPRPYMEEAEERAAGPEGEAAISAGLSRHGF